MTWLFFFQRIRTSGRHVMLIFPEIWKNRKFIAVIAAVLLCNTVYYAVRMAYGII